jgi:hypothetical protein
MACSIAEECTTRINARYAAHVLAQIPTAIRGERSESFRAATERGLRRATDGSTAPQHHSAAIHKPAYDIRPP